MIDPINPVVEERLRQGFRYLNRFMVLMWRLGLGQFMNRRGKTQVWKPWLLDKQKCFVIIISSVKNKFND